MQVLRKERKRRGDKEEERSLKKKSDLSEIIIKIKKGEKIMAIKKKKKSGKYIG